MNSKKRLNKDQRFLVKFSCGGLVINKYLISPVMPPFMFLKIYQLKFCKVVPFLDLTTHDTASKIMLSLLKSQLLYPTKIFLLLRVCKKVYRWTLYQKKKINNKSNLFYFRCCIDDVDMWSEFVHCKKTHYR